MRGRTEENAIPPSCGTPPRSHCSVDIDSLAVQFFHVQLVRAEGIATQYGLAVRRVSSRTVLRRDVIFLPDSRSESSRRSHVPITSHNDAAREQNSWIRIALVLTRYRQRTLGRLGVVNDFDRAGTERLVSRLTTLHPRRVGFGGWVVIDVGVHVEVLRIRDELGKVLPLFSVAVLPV